MTKKKRNDNNGILYREFKPKTKNQHEYIRAIVENDIIICTGPAGTGKTCVAAGIGIEHLIHGKVDRLVITRPVVESGRGLGYLPGDYQNKIHPYLVPLLDEFNTYLDPCLVQQKIREEIIRIVPLEYMRGYSFHNSFIILDEGQNATLDQIKMFLTRIGSNSTCVINGDLTQSDLDPVNIGLNTCIRKLTDVESVAIIELTYADVIRNSLISKILAKLDGK